MIVAIHQPNYFPWIGYFHKIAKADTFVFLDGVEYSKGSWINRVKILTGGKPAWISCPVAKGSGHQLIRDVTIGNDKRWKTKTLRTIEQNYSRAPFFADVFPVVCGLHEKDVASLADFNISAITELAGKIGLTTRFVRQTELDVPALNESGSRRLATICKGLDADTYLAGGGSSGYEDESAYEKLGINIDFIRFANKQYSQHNSDEFAQGLSIVDVLMNIGFDETLSFLTERR